MAIQKDDNNGIVESTLSEVGGDSISKEHIIARLVDWQTRVSDLYKFIRAALGDGCVYDQSGKQKSGEELVQKFRLRDDEIPAIDILRIDRLNGDHLALIMPRGLWIIGANGRLDLRVLDQKTQKPTLYLIVDKSMPMSGQKNVAWHIVDPINPRSPQRLTSDVVRSVVGVV